jgi:hypothetical protein
LLEGGKQGLEGAGVCGVILMDKLGFYLAKIQVFGTSFQSMLQPSNVSIRKAGLLTY